MLQFFPYIGLTIIFLSSPYPCTKISKYIQYVKDQFWTRSNDRITVTDWPGLRLRLAWIWKFYARHCWATLEYPFEVQIM